MISDFSIILDKVGMGLDLIATNLIVDMIQKFGMDIKDIKEAARNVTASELEQFADENEAISVANDMILVYLVVLRQRMGLDNKTYDR